MISKEKFVELLNFIKTQNIKQENFIKALEELSPGTYCDCLCYSEYEYMLLGLMGEILKDKDDDIYCFLYETDWINDNFEESKCPMDSNGKFIYSSPETLYDYLVKRGKRR